MPGRHRIGTEAIAAHLDAHVAAHEAHAAAIEHAAAAHYASMEQGAAAGYVPASRAPHEEATADANDV